MKWIDVFRPVFAGGGSINCFFTCLDWLILSRFVVVYINVLHCATSWKVAGSIPGVNWNFSLTSFRPHCGPGIDSASSRNEYQEYFLVGKGGGCLRLTTLPPSCADGLETCEPQPPGTLRACPGLHCDCFTLMAGVSEITQD